MIYEKRCLKDGLERFKRRIGAYLKDGLEHFKRRIGAF